MAEEYQRETAALDTVVPLSPTAGALTDILSKASGARTFDKATDSLEALRDKINTLSTPVSTASATTTGVIVEDGTSGTPNVVSAASESLANTFGSWVQVDASAAADCWISSVLVSVSNTGTDPNTCIEIGTGAAGSEATKGRWSFLYKFSSDVGYLPPVTIPLPIPIKVASNTRIAVRASDSQTAAKNYTIGVQYYKTLET